MLPRRDLLTFFFPTDLTFVIQMFEFLNTVVVRYTFIPAVDCFSDYRKRLCQNLLIEVYNSSVF